MDSKGALAELKAFQGSRKGAGDYYSQYQQELGVGDAQARSNDIRGLIRNTEGALKGVNQSVAGRTRGQGVNEAQRARLEGLERAPIAEELGTLQGSFADEQQNYRDLLGQATTRAGQSYQTDADKLAALESNYNKLFQSEQAAAEQARWERELAERNRQFQLDFDARNSQFERSLRNTREQYAQQATFNSRTAADVKAAADAEAARQRALEEEARHVRQGAESAKKNPRKEVSLWDAFWQPMGNSISNVQRWLGF